MSKNDRVPGPETVRMDQNRDIHGYIHLAGLIGIGAVAAAILCTYSLIF